MVPSDETVRRRESLERNAVAHGVVWFGAPFAASLLLGGPRVESALVVAGVGAGVYASIVHAWEPY